MQSTLDLLSDLHVRSDEVFIWGNKPTSLFCLVAGNVSDDRQVLYDTLSHLGDCYSNVLFIDGPLEHKGRLHDLQESYASLTDVVNSVDNVTYLQNHVVVLNDTAILATNGWWSYDFQENVDHEQSILWATESLQCSVHDLGRVQQLTIDDTNYLAKSISRLQRRQDIRKVIVSTCTVPSYSLIGHDPSINSSMRASTMGSRYIEHALNSDTENKVTSWCFGTYSGSVDTVRNGVRYINNARGVEGDSTFKSVYNPLRITL